MKEQTELLCKDCKHSFRKLSDFPQWWTGSEWRCRLNYIENEVMENRVTGNVKVAPYYARCSASRLDWNIAPGTERCGKDGKWWEPKHKKHLFLLIKKEVY
jgi:hypothetical protein